MKFCVALNGGNGASSFDFEDTAISFGRASENDIQIPDKSVSRKHMMLWGEEDNKYFVKYLGSENGTFVNGRQIPVGTTVEVRNGHSIMVGKSSIRISSKKPGLLFAFLQSGFPLMPQISDRQLSFS